MTEVKWIGVLVYPGGDEAAVFKVGKRTRFIPILKYKGPSK